MSWGVALRNAVGLGLGGIPSLLNAAPYAKLAFNFLSGVLDPRITFSRSSNATLIGSDGQIQYAPHNLLTYSEQFDNAAWTKAQSTIASNSVVAPDGTTTADKLVEDATLATHFTSQSYSNSNALLTFSIYIKAAERSIVRLQLSNNSTGAAAAFFDASSGVISSAASDGGDFTGSTATITSVGNGWYRCSLTTLKGAVNTTAWPYVTLASTGTTTSYTGDGVSGIYVWGAQLNVGALQPYYQTVASAYYGPRFDYDPTTLAPLGLLIEEQRTNLVFPSEDFASPWSIYNATRVADAGTAPDGTLTADRIDSSGAGIFRAGVGVVNATAYTYSVFLKHVSGTGIISDIGFERFGAVPLPGSSSFNLLTGTVISNGASVTASSITAFGNGWYRVSVTVTSTDVTTTLINYTPAGNQFLMWGAQLEQGAFLTSYIPTTTAAATRAADVASVTGANFSNWYNSAEGTTLVEASTLPNVTITTIPYAISDGTFNQSIYGTFITGNTYRGANVLDGGVAQANLIASFTGLTTTNNTKDAFAYKLNDFAESCNGVATRTDSVGTVPVVNRLYIGTNWSASGNFLNGHIRSFKYYPTRLRDSALQLLTR